MRRTRAGRGAARVSRGGWRRLGLGIGVRFTCGAFVFKLEQRFHGPLVLVQRNAGVGVVAAVRVRYIFFIIVFNGIKENILVFIHLGRS